MSSTPHGHEATPDLHPTVAERLAAASQRYTASRRSLVTALAGADGPLTLREVLERCAPLPQSSAYRNLAVLERAGVVHRVASSDEFSRFELAEPLTGHHHHLICDGCGRVDDFTTDAAFEASLDQILRKVAAAAEFAPDRHRLDLVGRCRDCR